MSDSPISGFIYDEIKRRKPEHRLLSEFGGKVLVDTTAQHELPTRKPTRSQKRERETAIASQPDASGSHSLPLSQEYEDISLPTEPDMDSSTDTWDEIVDEDNTQPPMIMSKGSSSAGFEKQKSSRGDHNEPKVQKYRDSYEERKKILERNQQKRNNDERNTI